MAYPTPLCISWNQSLNTRAFIIGEHAEHSHDKMTFEKHLRSVSSAAAQRLGIMRKSWQVFHDRSLLVKSFLSFVLLVLEYCLAVWCSAADSHLKLLGRVVRSAGFLAGGVLD